MKNRKLNKTLSFRVDEDLYNRIREEAFRFSKTTSQYMRDLMSFLVDSPPELIQPKKIELSQLHLPGPPIMNLNNEWITARKTPRRPIVKAMDDPYKISQKAVISELRNVLMARGVLA